METQEVLVVDAFAAEPLAGTPVGVVPDAAELTADQRRAVASELGASHTAFVEGSDDADRRLRFFTGDGEVDRADHATVAAFAALAERGAIETGEYDVELSPSTRAIEVQDDGTVWVEQGTVETREVSLDHEDVASALGVDVASLRDVGADLPLAVADAGVPWLLVPVNYFQHISSLDADMAAIEALCREVEADGFYAFTFDTVGGGSTLHGRGFVPALGVDEEPVTGTAAGACAAYIRLQGAIDDTVEQVVVEQGHFLDRPGTVEVDTDGLESWVGGRAVTTLQGTMTVPEDDGDDDIIEL